MINGISGAHWIIYSTDAEADRAFLRDVLGWRSVDAGGDSGGWPIFALPDSEVAVHPDDGEFVQRHGPHKVAGATLYLMCDDIAATVKSFAAHGVTCTPVESADWGQHTLIPLPSGACIGLYQPAHPTAI